MKKIISGILAALLLAALSTATAAPGTSGNSLVSKSYVEDTFRTELLNEAKKTVDSKLQDVYDKAVQGGGTTSADPKTARESISVDKDYEVTVKQGGTLILTKGAMTLTVSSGEVIDASTGKSVKSGSALELNRRYVCTEDTVAVFAASEASVAVVEGARSIAKGAGTVTPPAAGVFTDVKQDAWYFAAVYSVFDRELMNGITETTFNPNGTASRSMVATILWRMDSMRKVDLALTYPDVDADTWYTDGVRWATYYKIVTGYDNGKFGTNDNVTREQFATMLQRFADYLGLPVSVTTDPLSGFPDKSKVSTWATDATAWAVDRGIITGKGQSNGTTLLDPKGTASRAELATMIKRFADLIDATAQG